MLLAPSISGLFKWRQFEPEVILLAVGWYLRFSLSYREVEELLAERCLLVDHVTVWRWVQRYAPELQRRLRRHLKPTSDALRLKIRDEGSVKNKAVYLALGTRAWPPTRPGCRQVWGDPGPGGVVEIGVVASGAHGSRNGADEPCFARGWSTSQTPSYLTDHNFPSVMTSIHSCEKRCAA